VKNQLQEAHISFFSPLYIFLVLLAVILIVFANFTWWKKKDQNKYEIFWLFIFVFFQAMGVGILAIILLGI